MMRLGLAVATAALMAAGGAGAQGGPGTTGGPPGPWQTCDVAALVRTASMLSLQCEAGAGPGPKRIVRLVGDANLLTSATSIALASKTQRLRLQYRAAPVPRAQAERCRAGGRAQRTCHLLTDIGLDFPDDDRD